MSIINLDIDPAALDPDGICENQTQLIGVSLDLDGALCDVGTALQFNIGDSYSDGVGGVKLLFDSAGVISTVVFTIIGKDQDGITVSPAETVTGVTTTAVSTVNYYSEVTEIQTSVAAVDSNVFVGTVTGELATRTIPLNRYADRGATATISGLTGTCQYDIQATYSNLNDGVENANWYVEVSDQSTDQANQLVANATGVRLVFDSYTDGAELQFGVVYNPYR
jgi:hypothetical protein